MKKFFLVLMLLCSFAVPGFANSFDQQPQRFVCVDTSQNGRRYVDLDSVQVVQYAPPAYQLSVVTYTLDYVNHSGFQYTQLYTYNYKDQTMKLTFKAALPCDEEGKLLNQAPGKVDGTALDILPYSQGYYVGNLIFHKAYNMYFSKNFPGA